MAIDRRLRARYHLMRVHQLADADHEEHFYTRPDPRPIGGAWVEWEPYDITWAKSGAPWLGPRWPRDYSQGANLASPRVGFGMKFGNPNCAPGQIPLFQSLHTNEGSYDMQHNKHVITQPQVAMLPTGREEVRYRAYSLPHWAEVFDSATSDMHLDDFLRTSHYRELGVLCEHPIWGHRRPQLWSQVSRKRIDKIDLWANFEFMKHLLSWPEATIKIPPLQGLMPPREEVRNTGKESIDPQWSMTGPGTFTIDGVPKVVETVMEYAVAYEEWMWPSGYGTGEWKGRIWEISNPRDRRLAEQNARLNRDYYGGRSFPRCRGHNVVSRPVGGFAWFPA